jgi:hypothetical protein
LRPGGALAIVETHWGVGHGDDQFFADSRSCYARWDPDHDPDFRPPTLDEVPEQRDDLANSQLFAQTRRGFLACIADLIESRFEGRSVRHDHYDLWLARTSTRPAGRRGSESPVADGDRAR